MELNSLLFPSPKTKISLEALLNGKMVYFPKLKRIAEDSQVPMSPKNSRPSEIMARYPSQCLKATKNVTMGQINGNTPISSRRSSTSTSQQPFRADHSLINPQTHLSTSHNNTPKKINDFEDKNSYFTSPSTSSSKTSTASFSNQKNSNSLQTIFTTITTEDDAYQQSSTNQSLHTVLSTQENSDVSMHQENSGSSCSRCNSTCQNRREGCNCSLNQLGARQISERSSKQDKEPNVGSFLSTIFGFSGTSRKKLSDQHAINAKVQIPSNSIQKIEPKISVVAQKSVIPKTERAPIHRVSLSCDQAVQPIPSGTVMLIGPSTPDNPMDKIRSSFDLFHKKSSDTQSVSSRENSSQSSRSDLIQQTSIKIQINQQQPFSENNSIISGSNSGSCNKSASSSNVNKRFTEKQMNDRNFIGYDMNVMHPIGYVPALYLESQRMSANLLIYFHGNGDDVHSSFPLLNHLRSSLEMNIIAVEYPGYGQYKTSQACSADTIEEDAEFVFEYVTGSLGFARENIVLLGRSLGTGPATYLASKYTVGGLALISAFTSIRAVVQEFAGFFKYIVKERFDNLGNIKKVTSPTFLLHGQSDRLISFKQSLVLKDNCKAVCEVRTPKEMNHREFDYMNDLSLPLMNFLHKVNFPLAAKLESRKVLPEGLSFHPTYSSQISARQL